MALAILELVGSDRSGLRFRIDTGTNRYYQLKVGMTVGRRSGIDWVDDVVFASPMAVNPMGGGLLDTHTEVTIPAQRVDGGRAYAQLFSFKTREGRAPAFSSAIRVPQGPGIAGPGLFDIPSFEMQTMMANPMTSFQPARRIPCRTYAEEFSGLGIGDLLSQIVKVAAPVVLGMLGGGQNAPGAGGPPAGGQAAADGGQPPAAADGLATLIASLLRAIPGLGGPSAGAPAVSGTQSIAGRRTQSTAGRTTCGNRFVDTPNGELSRPFIFGIDDALFGALIGQVVQVLPQLMNSANQGKLQLKQANNKLITDTLSGINQRLLMQQVLAAKSQAPAGGQTAELDQLVQLLQQLPAPTADPAAAPAAGAVAQSLSATPEGSANLSARAVLTFVTGAPVAWNGASRVLFVRNQPVQLRVRLVVAEPVPRTPLPKAILRIVFKGADQSILLEKTVKQKAVPANGTITVPIDSSELSRLPANKPIAVIAELRWLTSRGTEYKALGSADIALVDRYFVKERGSAVGPEVELTDMNRFRPFWNKLWEAPPLDAAKGSDTRKFLWELDVNAKYSVLLSPDHEANGLMDTRVLKAAKDSESLADRTEGRMKAGIELSISELNKLTPLWDGAAPLDQPRLDAFRTVEFAKANGSELVSHFKLKGRAGERGLVWVVPTFRRFEFTLGSVDRTDDAGQVVSVTDEKVQFPLPVAARAIGLKAK